jgi:hypothetical protein
MPTPQPEAFSPILIDKAEQATSRRFDDLSQSLLDKAFMGEL